MCVSAAAIPFSVHPPAPVTCLRTPPSYACLYAPSLSPAMRPTTQPHPSAISFSAVPCEIDYSEPYSTPWAISPESVLPVGPSVCIFFNSIRFCQSDCFMSPPSLSGGTTASSKSTVGESLPPCAAVVSVCCIPHTITYGDLPTEIASHTARRSSVSLARVTSHTSATMD